MVRVGPTWNADSECPGEVVFAVKLVSATFSCSFASLCARAGHKRAPKSTYKACVCDKNTCSLNAECASHATLHNRTQGSTGTN